MRYLNLVTYTVAKRELAVTTVRLLISQGVDAAAIRGHNGRFYQVIALPGIGPGDDATARQISALCSKITRVPESDFRLVAFSGEQVDEVITKENLP